MTVKGLLSRYLEHGEATGKQTTTLREYRRIAEKTVIPAIGGIKLAKLKASDLDRLYATLTGRGLKATSVRRVHSLIGSALRQAEKWDSVDHNVARRSTPPKIHAAEVEAPSPEALAVVVRAAEAIEPMISHLIFVAALTGARRGGAVWPSVVGCRLGGRNLDDHSKGSAPM